MASELPLLSSRELSPFPVLADEFNAFRKLYVDSRQGIDEEKYLEYFIGFRVFDFKPGDAYIDIASQDCPFSGFIGRHFGVQAYRQDLHYLERSKSPMDISGDACNLPFPDRSFSQISLFNSFEHFEDDRDTAFMVEAQRVLRPGGRLLIAPLEISSEYSIETDAGWTDPSGVKHLWGIGARYARTYDVQHFRERVVNAAPGLSLQVYRIEDGWPRRPECYMRWFAVFERLS